MATYVSLMPDVRIIDLLGCSETGQQGARRGAGEIASYCVADATDDRQRGGGPLRVGEVAAGNPASLGQPAQLAFFGFELPAPIFTAPPCGPTGGSRYVAATRRRSTPAGRTSSPRRPRLNVVDAIVVGRSSDRWGQEVVASVQLAHAVSLHYMYYNFARPHQSLKDDRGRKITPAMAAGLATYPWSVAQIAALLDQV